MDIQKLIDDYTSWIKNETAFKRIGEYYEITTPYLNNENDYIQIYVKQEGNDIIFSDDCVTMHNLKMNGLQLTRSRKPYIQRVLCQYGVQMQGDELTAKVPASNFAQKKHLFIQAMIRIEDLFIT